NRPRMREERNEQAQRGQTGSATEESRDSGAAYPFRENLEVFATPTDQWVRCVKCQHTLSRLDEDWTSCASKTRKDPTAAGPLMEPLIGSYELEQLFCPSCGVLLNTD